MKIKPIVKQIAGVVDASALRWGNLKMRSRILWICIFICFVSMLVLNYLFPIFTDDWSYSFVFRSDPPVAVTGLKELVISQYNHYFTWGGRFIVHFIAQFLLMLQPWMQDVINAMVFTIFIYLIYKLSNYGRKTNPVLFIIIYFFIWFFQPAFAATLLWITGSSNYLWGTLIILLFVYPYYAFFRDPAYSLKGILICICLFLGGIIAGWTNENISVAVALMLLFMCLYYKNRGELPRWAIVGFIGFCIGCALLLAAPGNYVRMDVSNDAFQSVTRLSALRSRIYTMGYHYIYYILRLVSIYVIGLIVLIKNKNVENASRRTVMLISAIFIITAHVAFGVMLASPQFPTRALFGIITFMVIAICILYSNIRISNVYVRMTRALVIVFLVVVLGYDYYRRYDVLSYAHDQWERRYEYVIQQKEKGIREIDIKEKIIMPDAKYHLEKLNFTFEGLKAAETAYNRLLNQLYEHKLSAGVTDKEVIDKYRAEFGAAVDDDVNIPLALGILWTMLKEPASKDIYALALEFDKVLGLSLDKAKPAEKEKIEVPDEIRQIAEQRLSARKDKNWAESDRLRDKLAEMGYAIIDSKDGYTIEKK